MNRVEIPYTVMVDARQRFLEERGLNAFSPVDSGAGEEWEAWLSDMRVYIASEVSTPGYTYVYCTPGYTYVYYCCSPEDYTLFLLKIS